MGFKLRLRFRNFGNNTRSFDRPSVVGAAGDDRSVVTDKAGRLATAATRHVGLTVSWVSVGNARQSTATCVDTNARYCP